MKYRFALISATPQLVGLKIDRPVKDDFGEAAFMSKTYFRTMNDMVNWAQKCFGLAMINLYTVTSDIPCKAMVGAMIAAAIAKDG